MKNLLCCLLLTLATPVLAQTSADEAAVRAPITQLFTGMKTSDSVVVLSAFLPGATLQTVENKQDVVSVRDERIANFARSVGKAPKGALDERITSTTIHIDGDLATAWTPYEFYYNGQRRHCGANAFTLVRQNGAWKIQAIIDTRRVCQ
jgi:hypothetical protein